MKPAVLCLILWTSLATAWSFVEIPGHGPHGEGIGPNNTQVLAQNHHPNMTKTVSFPFGAQNFTLRVNVTEIDPSDVQYDDDEDPYHYNGTNPRFVNTVFEIGWIGNATFNDTLAKAEGLPGNQEPKVCATYPLDRYSVKASNAATDDGDCTGVLGSDCMKALAQYSSPEGCSERYQNTVPDECMKDDAWKRAYWIQDLTGYTGEGHTYYNFTDLGANPLPISFFDSEIYGAGNTTSFDIAVERVNVIFLTGTRQTAVCIRVKESSSAITRANPWFAVAVSIVIMAYLL